MAPLLEGFRILGHSSKPVRAGRVDGHEIPSLGLWMAVGGHGKAQFAVQAQHLIDAHGSLSALLCVGAAGSLDHGLRFGDVVVGTATIEHDYRLRFVRRPLPRHEPDPVLLEALRNAASPSGVHFGLIASGDEDVIDRMRAHEIRKETGALCVAWEGSGGARAARFSSLPFAEIRCITDGADADAASDFQANLVKVMPHVAGFLARWRLAGVP